MAEDYSDRGKWSDVRLIDEYYLCVHQLEREKHNEIRAALLARMKPEAPKPEAGKRGQPPDCVVTIDDGYCIYKFELNGTTRYSIDNLISLITSNTELHVDNEKRIYPVLPQEPPVENEEEWEERELCDDELPKRGDILYWTDGKTITLNTDSVTPINQLLFTKVVSKVTRRVRKIVDIPTLSNDVPLSDPSVDVKVDSITNEPSGHENAENKDKALGVAIKALRELEDSEPIYGIYGTGFIHQIPHDALAEIDKLMKGEK
jgi:hypothetical protein